MVAALALSPHLRHTSASIYPNPRATYTHLAVSTPPAPLSPCVSHWQLNESRFVTGGNSGALQLWSVSKKKPLCKVTDAHGKGSAFLLDFHSLERSASNSTLMQLDIYILF